VDGGQDYVHGYSGRERERLADQADTLAELLHSDTFYPAGSVVLEVGCGVGAQTVTLAKRSPEATIVAMGEGGTKPSDEDEACAEYLASRLAGRSPDVAAAVAKLWEHEDPNWPAWFPRRDAELACEVDRFDFALPVVREDGLLVARPVRMSPATAGGAEPYQPRS